jgi:phage-related minor tail protein
VTPEDVVQIKEYVDELERADIATEAYAATLEADREASEAWTRAQEEGKRITESLQTPLEKYNAEVERLNEAHAAGTISAETWQRGIAKAQQNLEDTDQATSDLKEGMQDFTQVVGTAFEDAVLAGEDLRGVVKGLTEDIARLFLRMAVTKPMEGIFGNLFSSILGGGSDGLGIAGAAFAGQGGASPWKRQGGGAVAGQTPYLVGERGPELFVPRVPGSIVPNHALSAGAGGGGVHIGSIVVQSDAGTPDQNADNATKISAAIERAFDAKIKAVMQNELRDRGMFKPTYA